MSLKNGVTGFLDEKPGVHSFMRLMSFLVFALLVMIDYMVLKFSFYGKDGHTYDVYFISFMVGINLIFLIAIFYPKYLQKIIELGAANLGKFKDALAPLKASDINVGSQGTQVTEVKQTTEIKQ